MGGGGAHLGVEKAQGTQVMSEVGHRRGAGAEEGAGAGASDGSSEKVVVEEGL